MPPASVLVSEPYRILGAGPSGLAAAITLARAGRTVEVFERRADCGGQFRGDLQGLENWTADTDALAELQTLGLGTGLRCHPFTRAVHTNGRLDLHHRFEDPVFYLVKRGTAPDTLDQWLKARALAEGVSIRFRETAAPESVHIVATGPDARRPFAVDTGFVFDTDAPDMAVVLTHDDMAVKGYSYLLVAGGYGCLCTMLFEHFRSAPACLERARRLLPERYRVSIRNPRPVGGVGHFAAQPALSRGQSLVAGEAAGLQDFLWGFGIRTALRSGHLAATCLLEGRDYPAAARAAFAPGLRAGVVNRFLWETLRHGDYVLLMYGLRWGGRRLLRTLYGDGPLQRLLRPVADAYVRRRHPMVSF